MLFGRSKVLWRIGEYSHLMLINSLSAAAFFADKFSPPVLVYTAFGTVLWRMAVKATPIFPRLKLTYRSCAFILLIIWLAASALWSIDPMTSVDRFSKLSLMLIAGFYCAFGMEERPANDIFWLLALSCLIAIVLAVARYSDVPVVEMLGLDEYMDANRPQGRSVLMLTVFSGLIWAKTNAARNRTTRIRKSVAHILWFLTLVVALMTPGLSPVVFWAALTTVFWVSSRWPYLVWTICLCAMGLIMVVFPLLIDGLQQLFIANGGPPTWLQSQFSGDGRFEIWQRTIVQISERPLLGYGLGTERLLDVDMLHPHTTWLQIALNGGLVGLLLSVLVIVSWMLWLRDQKPDWLRTYLPLTVAFFAVATVGHGAWQTWWIATIAIVLNPNLRLTPDLSGRANAPRLGSP